MKIKKLRINENLQRFGINETSCLSPADEDSSPVKGEKRKRDPEDEDDEDDD